MTYFKLGIMQVSDIPAFLLSYSYCGLLWLQFLKSGEKGKIHIQPFLICIHQATSPIRFCNAFLNMQAYSPFTLHIKSWQFGDQKDINAFWILE